MAEGLVLAAPRSGVGKSIVTLGLLAALRARGQAVGPAKSGPDYIDAAILARAAASEAINLDAWAMRPERLRALAARHAGADGLLIVEGAMGLFDGALDGRGSTGDLAAALGLPVMLVVDAAGQGQSIAPLVAGFMDWREDVRVVGIVCNRVATTRHEAMLRRALEPLGLRWLGALPRREGLSLPSRHLGLVLPEEVARFDAVVAEAAALVGEYLDLEALQNLAAPIAAPAETPPPGLPPLGGRIAIARDEAFAFLYPHQLEDWRAAGAELSFFSPLADEAPSEAADAIHLPGGYPELHALQLSAALGFKAGLAVARDRGALIYGECGGFMVLGEALVDAGGAAHEMAGLLPFTTRIDRPARTLGYRRLTHDSPLPWPRALLGHEFHYSTVGRAALPPLFSATDALGTPLKPMGARLGRVMGSYAHVIDMA